MEKRIVKCVAAGLFAMPFATWAGGDSGFYIGAGIGNSKIEADARDQNGDKFKVDGDDTGYKLIAGYNFGLIPLVDLGVEASYVDFGKIDDNTPLGRGDAKASGYDAFGVGALTFGPFAVFAKAGAIKWDSETTVAQNRLNDSGTDAAYGVGARFQLFSFSIRGEYEVFDVSGLKDLTMLSLSALYTF